MTSFATISDRVQGRGCTGSVIETYHLSKLYNRGVYALRDLSLTIDKGEFLFLTGPSGAGKSTFLRLLLRQDLPSEGELKVRRPRLADPQPIAGAGISAHRRLRLPGFPSRSRDSPCFRTSRSSMRVLGLPLVDAAAQDVPGAQVGRPAAPDERAVPRSCRAASSSASRSRARWSTIRSSMLADEPTGNLDPDLSLEIMNLFREINARGTTVVVATHDRELIRRVGRRSITLDHGRSSRSPDDARAPICLRRSDGQPLARAAVGRAVDR